VNSRSITVRLPTSIISSSICLAVWQQLLLYAGCIRPSVTNLWRGLNRLFLYERDQNKKELLLQEYHQQWFQHLLPSSALIFQPSTYYSTFNIIWFNIEDRTQFSTACSLLCIVFMIIFSLLVNNKFSLFNGILNVGHCFCLCLFLLNLRLIDFLHHLQITRHLLTSNWCDWTLM
jgi:hypothetical protein